MRFLESLGITIGKVIHVFMIFKLYSFVLFNNFIRQRSYISINFFLCCQRPVSGWNKIFIRCTKITRKKLVISGLGLKSPCWSRIGRYVGLKISMVLSGLGASYPGERCILCPLMSAPSLLAVQHEEGKRN